MKPCDFRSERDALTQSSHLDGNQARDRGRILKVRPKRLNHPSSFFPAANDLRFKRSAGFLSSVEDLLYNGNDRPGSMEAPMIVPMNAAMDSPMIFELPAPMAPMAPMAPAAATPVHPGEEMAPVELEDMQVVVPSTATADNIVPSVMMEDFTWTGPHAIGNEQFEEIIDSLSGQTTNDIAEMGE